MVDGWLGGVQGFWIYDPDAARTGQVYDLCADGAGKSKPGFFDNRKTGSGLGAPGSRTHQTKI